VFYYVLGSASVLSPIPKKNKIPNVITVNMSATMKYDIGPEGTIQSTNMIQYHAAIYPTIDVPMNSM